MRDLQLKNQILGNNRNCGITDAITYYLKEKCKKTNNYEKQINISFEILILKAGSSLFQLLAEVLNRAFM